MRNWRPAAGAAGAFPAGCLTAGTLAFRLFERAARNRGTLAAY
jgi:hypothetical protein